jgi:hypothetical protein
MSYRHRLNSWEEGVGVLDRLSYEEGFLLARIGRVELMLPLELEEKLSPHIGTRIGLLRTDSATRPYLIRVISSDLNGRIAPSNQFVDVGFGDGSGNASK